MKNATALTAAVLGFCLSACDSSTADAGGVSPSAAAVTPAQGSASAESVGSGIDAEAKTQALEAKLSEGMAYADLRTSVLEAGWLPVQDYSCSEKTGGEARICQELPELEACSGDGRCVMWFGHDGSGSLLRVDAFGDYTKWQLAGDGALLNVRAWEFSEAGSARGSAEAASASPACPANDFQGFLQAFAADDSVQRAFTRPLVKVMQYRELEEASDTYPALVRAEDYDEFRFEHDQAGFHVVHADGEVDPTPTPLKVSEATDGGYSVSYQYGMSEGNSYVFVKQKGCWYLAADPEAPTP